MNTRKNTSEQLATAPLFGLVVAVDFDGTCVTHEYPKVGRYIGAEPVLRRMVNDGAKLILWTMRSGEKLQDAVTWFAERETPLKIRGRIAPRHTRRSISTMPLLECRCAKDCLASVHSWTGRLCLHTFGPTTPPRSRTKS